MTGGELKHQLEKVQCINSPPFCCFHCPIESSNKYHYFDGYLCSSNPGCIVAGAWLVFILLNI
ncbi:hypothetical protein D5F51_18995 [Yersinia hibernica]|uniref:Uncharacterized protein n=1 Tax=Yersinia hibernica TaxID=2339259 RepID=A0ABX5R4S9_9GAMM|nr:hypothetical protein D5F51_18995 [Yersinia hibernica]